PRFLDDGKPGGGCAIVAWPWPHPCCFCSSASFGCLASPPSRPRPTYLRLGSKPRIEAGLCKLMRKRSPFPGTVLNPSPDQPALLKAVECLNIRGVCSPPFCAAICASVIPAGHQSMPLSASILRFRQGSASACSVLTEQGRPLPSRFSKDCWNRL